MRVYQYFSRPEQPDTKPQAKQPDEKTRKAAEEKAAALDKIEWCSAMIARYAELAEQIEKELNGRPGMATTKQIQLKRQALGIEEKIRRLDEQRNKCYFVASKND